jgi:spore coat-associated protein N
MKKILGLTIAAVMIMVMVGGGTWAYFSDTETSADNSLTAGTMDLNIDGGNSVVNTFTASNVAPGDTGSGSSTLDNVGNLEGELDIAITALVNTGGSGGTEFEDGVGDLGGVALMAIYIDVDQSGTFNAGDIGLKYDGTTYSFPATLQYASIDSYSTAWDAAATMSAGAQYDVMIDWEVPTSAGNNIQGDAVSFGILFTLEQAAAD